jgi:hypothetical protein
VEPDIGNDGCNSAARLCELKAVKIGKDSVRVGRYYHDYQLFIKKPKSLSKEKIREYFQQFGEVVDIVEMDSADHKGKGHNSCYIKIRGEKTIDTIVLAKLHKVGEKD